MYNYTVLEYLNFAAATFEEAARIYREQNAREELISSFEATRETILEHEIPALRCYDC